MITLDHAAWTFLVSAPFLAALVAWFIFNAYTRSRRREWLRERDHWRNMDYRSWREWVKAQGGIRPMSLSQVFGVKGPCFLLEHDVALYEPQTLPPFEYGTVEEPLVDPPRDTLVGEGWSVMGGFGGVRRVGKGSLCVTKDAVLFRGVRTEVKIPVGEIHTVVASCSGILLVAESSDVPFLFDEVNGQKFRDVISFLLEA